MRGILIALIVLLLSSVASAQSISFSDGCNTHVCNEFGGCFTTAVYCQSTQPTQPVVEPSYPVQYACMNPHLVSVKGGYTIECEAPFVEPHEKLFHAWIIAAGGLQLADKMQTAYIIGQGNGRELNPILAPFSSRPVVFGAVEGAMLTSSIILATKYHASPNPTLRWAARIIVMEATVLGTWAVVNNQKHLR